MIDRVWYPVSGADQYQFCIHCEQTCYLDPGRGNCCGSCLQRFEAEGEEMAACPCCGSHVPAWEITRCAWCCLTVCDRCIYALHNDDPDCRCPDVD